MISVPGGTNELSRSWPNAEYESKSNGTGCIIFTAYETERLRIHGKLQAPNSTALIDRNGA